MKLSEKILNLAKSTFTSGEVFYTDIRDTWGSEKPNFRSEIRQAILDYLKAHHPTEATDKILDLDAPPILKSMFVSISHCQGMGGFVLSSKSLGFDIEDTSRITQKIIDRISSEDEIKSCPQVELLWPAKEATFKCSTEFYTISHIQILKWDKSQNDTYSFSSLTVAGWAFLDSNHSYAVAIKKT